MATTFDDIIYCLKTLDYNDWNELNRIKPLAAELIKRSFPYDFATTVFKIDKLTFKPSIIFHDGRDNSGYLKRAWDSDRSIFKALIEAKKETYDLYREKLLEEAAQKESAQIRFSNIEILRLTNELKKVKQDNFQSEKEHTATLAVYEKTINELKTIITHKESEIVKQAARTRKFNVAYWGIIIGIAAAVFPFGYYLGNNRFDAEKLSMRDSIISLKKQNQALKEELIPKIKQQSLK